MHKSLLALAFALFTICPVSGQVSVVGNPIDHGPTLPTTCTVSQVFKLTVVEGLNVVGFYSCDAANVWTYYGSGGTGGDTLSSPNSTINVGGSSVATTVDVAGSAGKIMAGATPGLTFTPSLGVDGSSAGTWQFANGSVSAHSILGSAATTSNTVKLFATAPVTGDLVSCTTSGTTCTLSDSGVLAANVLTAASPSEGLASFAGSGQGMQAATATDVGTTIDLAQYDLILSGGTSAAPTGLVVGAGKAIQGSATTPTATYTPTLGVPNSNAGTLTTANGSANASTTWGSAATTSNTVKGPAVVLPDGTLAKCSTSSTTCTITPSSIVDNATYIAVSEPILNASVAFASLPTPTAGMQIYCSDCQVTTAATCSTAAPASCVCKASGTGAFARYMNYQNGGAGWYCQ